MSLPFYIAHTTHGRARIRWAGDKEQKHQVSEVAKKIEQVEGITFVQARPATGSIVIEYPEAGWTEIAPLLEQQASIQFCETPSAPLPTGLQSLHTGLDKIDDVLRQESQNSIDLKNLTVMMLLMLAIIQAMRGQVLVSASSFLWFAMNVAMQSPSNAVLEEITPTE